MNIAALTSYYYRRQAYSEEYQAVLDRATALGYTKPSSSASAAWDTFLAARVSDGSLAKMDLLYNFAWNNTALSNFASIDYITATRQASYVNSPTYGVRGPKGNGTTSYVNANFNPSTNGVNYTLNSASRGVWVSTAPLTGSVLDGSITSLTNFMNASNASNHRINQGANNLSATVDLSGTGYTAIDRQTSTNVSLYKGITKSDRTATSVAVANESQVLLKVSTFYSDAEIAMYYMGGTLTQTQHNNIRNDYQTFLTAIGL